MLGALGFLVHVPMKQGSSGVVFHLGPWALTLLLLAQAVLAAWSRDFRSHMVWMALVFAALATAPMLRLDWVLLPHLWPQANHEMVNLASGLVVFLQALLVMALWLSLLGDRDLLAARRRCRRGRVGSSRCLRRCRHSSRCTKACSRASASMRWQRCARRPIGCRPARCCGRWGWSWRWRCCRRHGAPRCAASGCRMR
jgi:hypothetical protein